MLDRVNLLVCALSHAASAACVTICRYSAASLTTLTVASCRATHLFTMCSSHHLPPSSVAPPLPHAPPFAPSLNFPCPQCFYHQPKHHMLLLLYYLPLRLSSPPPFHHHHPRLPHIPSTRPSSPPPLLCASLGLCHRDVFVADPKYLCSTTMRSS